MSIHMPLELPATDITPAAPAQRSARRMTLALLGAWAGVALLLVAVSWSHIASFTMWDSDDYMRLAQVRDWIGGQSFFDVGQYRFDPPRGFAMHWSRIVDIPIAAIALALSPLTGGSIAERIAVTLVPLLTLGGIMAGAALATARLANRGTALIAAIAAATTPLILFYTLPLRIDHHGWQVLMAVLTLACCFDRDARRGGALAGLAAATWLAISMEGLPLVTAIAVMHGLRFAIEGRAFQSDRRLRALALGLGCGSLGWLIGLHGPHGFARSYGDMLSPAWLGPLSIAPLIVVLAMPLVADRGIAARLSLLIAAAMAGLGALLSIDPTVLSGPFATLDPLVRIYWYNNVVEGLPIWEQGGDTMMMLVMFPIVGLAGTILAWRTPLTAETRRNWLAMLFLAGAAFAVSLFVQRAGAVSHAYMLPGMAVLLAGILAKVAAWRSAPRRVLASVSAILFCSPLMTASLGIAALGLIHPQPPAAPAPYPVCADPCDAYGALNRLPPAYILGSLDMGPMMLVNTRHSFVAGGYHRNPAAIHAVIASFTEPPETAHRLMARHGMTYLMIDPNGNEAGIYGHHAPNGLMAKLLGGHAPAWLEPVRLPHSPYRLWRRIA